MSSDAEPKIGTRVTTNKCPKCGEGNIIEKISREWKKDVPPMFRIRGPAGRSQTTIITTYYCSKCGTQSKFFPGSDDASKSGKKQHKVAV